MPLFLSWLYSRAHSWHIYLRPCFPGWKHCVLSLGDTLAQNCPTPRIQGCAARLGEISPSGSFMDETKWEKSHSKLGNMVSFPSLYRNSTLRERSCWRFLAKSPILMRNISLQAGCISLATFSQLALKKGSQLANFLEALLPRL